MKKTVSIITLIALIITSLAIFASCGGQKAPASVNDTSFGNITWSYSSDTKTLKIRGNDESPVAIQDSDFEKGSSTPWYSLRSYAARLELSGVSHIPAYSFHSMYALQEIIFCDSITSIGKCAFTFCTSLKSLKLNEGVTTVGESAFEGCALLESVELPESLTELGDRAFAYNHALSKAKIFSGTKLVGDPFLGIQKNFETELYEKATEPPATEEPAATEEPTASESETETETEADSESETTDTEKKPIDMTQTIIMIIVFALVLIGIIVGAVLLVRSNKKQTKDARTVRKNSDGSKNTNDKNNKKKK